MSEIISIFAIIKLIVIGIVLIISIAKVLTVYER